MDGTVYFAVFKNIQSADGDTFGTGLANVDTRFEAGRSFKDGMSLRYDKKAKYLYLYQVVNDRSLDPRINQVKGAKGGEGIRYPHLVPGAKLDAKSELPIRDDIASFALKLSVDPTVITSWGHFRDSGFASLQHDLDNTNKTHRHKVDNVEKDRIVRMAFSHLAPKQLKISNPTYSRHAHALGEFETDFGVADSSHNLTKSKAHLDLMDVHAKIDTEHLKVVAHVGRLVKAAEAGKEPDYVQIMFAPPVR